MAQEIGTAGRRVFKVRIVYSEPEFHERNPHTPMEFTSLFEVPGAASHDDAVRQALAEWHSCAHHSWVSWRRVIRKVSVES